MNRVEIVVQRYMEELMLSIDKEKIDELVLGNQIEVMVVSKYNALALYLGWSSCIAILPNGSFISFDYDEDVCRKEVAEEWRIISLVEASQRYPLLRELLPCKTKNARKCQFCNGLGKNPFGKHFLFCSKCLGLGWVDDYIISLSNRFCKLPE